MQGHKVNFENARGERLAARVDLPLDGKARAWALFAHCFTCTKNLKAVGHVAGALTARGIGVLRFDFTGLGESEGDFADTNFSSNVEDLVRAADWLRENHEAPQLLVGHSLGGAAVLQAAHHVPEARAVATIGAPADPGHVTHLLQGARDAIERDGEAEVLLAGRPFRIKKQFLDDLEETRMAERIRTLKRALLILHSPVDETVGIDNAAKIYTAAKHPKSFVSLHRADHLLMQERDARYAGSTIAAWAEYYLETEPEDAPDLDGAEVLVRTGSGYRSDVHTGRHALVADEPKRLGGTDLGPNPYEYLLAALGSCTGITMRMVANRDKYPMEAVHVRLTHRKVHAKDCEDCDTEHGKVDVIDRELEIVGDALTDEQRAHLVKIADRCPVHRTLHAEVKVRTRVRN